MFDTLVTFTSIVDSELKDLEVSLLFLWLIPKFLIYFIVNMNHVMTRQ